MSLAGNASRTIFTGVLVLTLKCLNWVIDDWVPYKYISLRQSTRTFESLGNSYT